MLHLKMSFWDEKEAKRLFQELPFYNVLIEKPHIKRLKIIELLHGLPFYDDASIVKISEAYKRYERSYRIEIKDLWLNYKFANQALKICLMTY